MPNPYRPGSEQGLNDHNEQLAAQAEAERAGLEAEARKHLPPPTDGSPDFWYVGVHPDAFGPASVVVRVRFRKARYARIGHGVYRHWYNWEWDA